MDGSGDSPARGLKGMLSRNRRGRDDTAGNQKGSQNDNSNARDDSTESSREKFKPRPSLAGLEGDVPGSRKHKEKGSSKAGAAEGALAKTPTRSSSGVGEGESANGSAHGSVNDPEAASLLTSESEGERDRSQPTARSTPSLTSHDSHRGYLTSSSPQVKTTTVEQGNGVAGVSSLSVDPADSPGSMSRSRSPSSRIKDAFKPGSKRSTGNLRDSPKSPGLDSGTTDTIASRRSKSIVESSTSNHPYVDTRKSAAHKSDKSLPSIVMTPGTPPPPIPTSSYEKLPLDADLSNALDAHEASSSNAETGSSKASGAVTNSLQHRRARSESLRGPPSKLGHSMNPPLTPMIEEVRTPPASRNASQSSNSGGFFVSMFSAAQNAASTLTTTLGTNRPKSSSSLAQQNDEDNTQKPTDADAEPAPLSRSDEEGSEQAKTRAIDTIGSGELSLSHLGISSETLPSGSASQGPSTPADPQNRSRSGTVVRREEAAAREEGISAARAVSAAYEDYGQPIVTPVVEDTQDVKIAAVLEKAFPEKPTTPTGSVMESESGLQRSSSLKNKIDRRRRRRHGSQSTTGGPLVPSVSSITAPNGSAPKLSGFAVASMKRNRDFHTLFKSVPEDDYLIEDYSCALQRDIILAGRLYISEGHICFSSNILGWVTTLVISFDEVVSVEKEVTAMVFPNAIAVQTLHARHTFRSLLSRETTYDLLIGIWKISHPGLMSSENGVRVANGTGSKTEKLERGSDNESDGLEDEGSGDDDDSDGSDDDDGTSLATGDDSAAPTDAAPSPPKSTIPRKASNVAATASQATGPPVAGDAKAMAAAAANGAALAGTDFPGPQAHAPTECSDSATHYPNVLKDEVIPAPLGKIYSLMFGNASGTFMSRWLVEEMKVTELQMEDDKKGLGDENKSRSFSYIKPLGGSIGPKQTKCIITEQLDSLDFEKAASITVTTQTPDVPSGNVFSTKTRYCLMWGPNNGTRMIMSCVIEWTGKSWLKGPIEKGANDGQAAYANDLFKALRAAVSKGRAPGTPGGKVKKSKRKKAGEGEKSGAALDAASETKPSDWGLFEPLHGVLGPVADIVGTVISMQTLVAILFALLMLSWTRGSLFGRSPSTAADGLPRTGHLARIAAYEELWRSEEAALWSWLDQRVGGGGGGGATDGLYVPLGGGGDAGRPRVNADMRAAARRERQQILRGENGRPMSEREVWRALEITQEKLRVLQEAMQERSEQRRMEGGKGKEET